MNKVLIVFLAALSTLSCSREPIGCDNSVNKDATSKISNSPQDALPGELVVRFSGSAAEQIESSAIYTKAAADNATITRSGVATIDDALTAIEAISIEPLFAINVEMELRAREAGLHKWYVIEFNDRIDLQAAATTLSRIDAVEIVQFNEVLKPTYNKEVYPYSSTRAQAASDGLPCNDAALGDQWNYNNTGDKKFATEAVAGADINLFDAWQMSTGDPSVIVAVLDSGIEYNHPDLEANMWVNSGEIAGNGIDDDNNGYIDDVHGYNFVDQGAITWDLEGDIGHGTHVAGTIAAVNNNNIGVCGIAGGGAKGNGVRIMSCQIDSAGNNASDKDVAKAIQYAADNGASIIQCSMGRGKNLLSNDNDYEKRYPLETDAFNYFLSCHNSQLSDGNLVIYAAGNDKFDKPSYPGAHRKYISVSALGADYKPAYYTNYGAGTNIMAPGGDQYVGGEEYGMILSTLPASLNGGNGYGYMEGTSMACPHVSGVAALALSYAAQLNKTFTVEEFKSMLLTSVNDAERYLTGGKYADGSFVQMETYSKKMGTGLIDAAQLCLQVEGVPMLKVSAGKTQMVELNNFFGQGASNLTYIGVEMNDEEMSKLGISELPTMNYGKLKINCTKSGVARLRVKAIAGGSEVGSSEVIGGMEISKEFAVVARFVESSNGGWL